MKNVLVSTCIAVLLGVSSLSAFAAETQKVCVDKTGKDGKPVVGKDGKPEQVCKQVKIDKKLEGTAVPEKK